MSLYLSFIYQVFIDCFLIFTVKEYIYPGREGELRYCVSSLTVAYRDWEHGEGTESARSGRLELVLEKQMGVSLGGEKG